MREILSRIPLGAFSFMVLIVPESKPEPVEKSAGSR
jgi:hypothetical protein